MSKKFTFSLEAVKKLRAHKEEISKNSFLKVSAMRIAQDESIKRVLKLKNDIMVSPVRGTTLDEQLQNRSYVKLLQKQIENLNKERQRLAEIEEIKRKEYTGKMKDHEAMKIVRKKKEADHRYEMLKDENSMMEEIALNRYIREDDNN